MLIIIIVIVNSNNIDKVLIGDNKNNDNNKYRYFYWPLIFIKNSIFHLFMKMIIKFATHIIDRTN